MIDFLVENPQELSATIENERKKNGQFAADRLEAAVDARRRRADRPNVKGIADMINDSTRAINPGYNFAVGVVEQKQPSAEEVASVAKIINEGTADVLAHPNLTPEQAVRFGQLERRLKNE